MVQILLLSLAHYMTLYNLLNFSKTLLSGMWNEDKNCDNEVRQNKVTYITFLARCWPLVNMKKMFVPFLLLTTSIVRMTHLLELGGAEFHFPYHMIKDTTGF